MDNHSAKITNLSEDDVKVILSALWSGTKNLITRTKMGQMPRFMLVITYKNDTFAGDLNNCVAINSSKEDIEIRSINDFTIDFSRLKAKLTRYAQEIEKIEYMSDFDFEQNNRSQFDSNWIKIGF